MKNSRKKYIIGIIGAVGAGKSTVAAEFARLGCGIVRADELNHELLMRSEIIERLVGWWGVGILKPDGRIDRSIVADIVFGSAAELKKLTDLVHPLIERRIERLIHIYQEDTAIKAVVLDVPLLIEADLLKLCDFVIFVKTNEQNREKRLKNNRHWTPQRIKIIENLQISLDFKEKMSEYTINNNSGIPATASQVEQLFLSILEQKKR
ncbi:MAG: dephospho-CoA kinase [Sedimentisphaerales bacterium]|nr:dephospho-CoA kinase [Sedimentisphaerales bacterium]